jgi:hypothetical protein
MPALTSPGELLKEEVFWAAKPRFLIVKFWLGKTHERSIAVEE